MPKNTESLRGVRILVVEDEVLIAEEIRERLSRLGAEIVDMVDSGSAAQRTAEVLRPDLVLMDIRLKGAMTGIEAAEAMRQKLRIPVIFLTAHSDWETVLRAKKSDPFGYILKPFQEADLVATVQVALHRHSLERQLIESERRFEATLSSIGEGVIAADAEGRITFLNPVAEALTQWPLAEAEGRAIEDVFSVSTEGTTTSADNPALLALRRRQVVHSLGLAMLSVRDGRRIPVDVSAAPIVLPNDDDKLLGTVVAFRDITDRKRAEHTLWERETILLQSQRIARIGSWSVEVTTDDVTWTDETYRLYGVSRESFVPSAEAISGLAHPDDRGALQAHVEAFLGGKTPRPLEFRVPLSDGQERVLCGQGEIFRDETGRPARMIGTVQDITERKRAEQALSEREALLLQSQRIAGIGSWSVDLITRHVTWTENTYQLCGVSPETFVPSVDALIGLVHPDDRSAVQEYIQASFADENPRALEFRVPLPNGQVRILCGQGEIFRDDTGRPVRMIGTIQDMTERKRAEQSLRLAKFSIDRAACPIFWDGPDAKILYANEAACRMLGYSKEELTRMTICDIDPLLSSPEKYAAGWAALPRQGSLTFETKHLTKDGRVLDVEVTSNIIEYEGRELDCAMVRDITERKRVERSLRESEQRNRTILRTARDGFWRTDLQGRLLEVNEAYCRMSGYTEQELLAMSVPDLEATETSAEVAAHIQRIVAMGADRFENWHRRKDGSIYAIEVSVQYRPAAGQFFAFLRDIAERKQGEQSLRESEQRNRTILRTAMDGFWRNDLQGRLLEVNEAYCRMSGYSEQELLAMSVPDLEAAETSADVAAHMLKIVGQGADRFESRHRRKDGSTYPIEVGVQYRPEAGQFFAFLRDITERKRAEQSLRESEQRNRTIVRTAMDGFWRLDLQGRLLEVNEAFCRMSGYSRSC